MSITTALTARISDVVRQARDARHLVGRVSRADQLRFREDFAAFWNGDDDCWDEGRTDALADAALRHLAVGDVDRATRAVTQRARRDMGLTLSLQSVRSLHLFLFTHRPASARREAAVAA